MDKPSQGLDCSRTAAKSLPVLNANYLGCVMVSVAAAMPRGAPPEGLLSVMVTVSSGSRANDLGVTGFAELGPGGVLTGMAKRTLEGSRTISVSTPDELDKFIEWVNNAAPTGIQQHEGEHLFAVERLVVSPASGVFAPLTSFQTGDRIAIGQTLGMIGDTPVVSVFEGILQSFIAVDGERVTLRQPIAWLRTI